MAGGWGCPHEVDDRCTRVLDRPCDPGMKGCVLAGRFVFADESKNLRPGSGKTEPEDNPAGSETPGFDSPGES